MSKILDTIVVDNAKKDKKQSVLEVKNVSHHFYQGGVKIDVLNDASFEVKKGEIVALVGPSGCGKSTLLHIIGMLEKPSAGEIFIDGKRCDNLHDNGKTKTRLKKIGFVYQSHNLLPDFSALENVMIPLYVSGLSKSDASEKAKESLKKLGLDKRLNHTPALMSGGECQRVAIARALVNDPILLLADEPTGNLDPKTSEAVFDELLKTVKKTGMSALIVTHDLVLARKMDRVLRLKDGKIL